MLKGNVNWTIWNSSSDLSFYISEAATRGALCEKVFLEIWQNSHENTCSRVSFLIKLPEASNFINKETLAQVFSCEFCEISQNTFFTENLWTTASNIYLSTICFGFRLYFSQFVNSY